MEKSTGRRWRGACSADLQTMLEEIDPVLNLGDGAAPLTVGDTPQWQSQPTPILFLSSDPRSALEVVRKAGEDLRLLSAELLAGELSAATLKLLCDGGLVNRAELMKRHVPLLDEALPVIGLPLPEHAPDLADVDGRDVLVGIIDSGFDLTHPCFWEASGQLRVEGLLDQTTGRRSSDWKKWSAKELADSGGFSTGDAVHGTHVASIAAGSPFGNLRGVAPGARYLLIKTDFVHTVDAMEWISDEASRLKLPCVVNCSFGHHDGAHDGTHIEELRLKQLSRRGFIVVAAAGNSGNSAVHARVVLNPGVTREIPFRVMGPYLKLSGWYSSRDDLSMEVIRPDGGEGQAIPFPGVDAPYQRHKSDGTTITLKRAASDANECVEVSVLVQIKSSGQHSDGWKLRLIPGEELPEGVVDFWVATDKAAEFQQFVQNRGTITMPATSEFCLSVGSFASKSSWRSDAGIATDPKWSAGVSAFSSRGPTRSGSRKPNLLAPGEWVSAACATGWQSDGTPAERVLNSARVVTLRGTSHASPVVAGTIALMLQKRKDLTLGEVRRILELTARKWPCVCGSGWCEHCGFGVLDAVRAVRDSLVNN